MVRQRSESQYFLTMLLLVAALVLFIFLPELNVIVLGISLAVLFQPLYDRFRRAAPVSEAFAAGVIVLFAIAIIVVPLVFFGFEIFLEAQGLYGHLAGFGSSPFVTGFYEQMHDLFPSLNINLTSSAQQVLGNLLGDIGPIFTGVVAAVGSIFLSFFAFYYFLKDGPKLRPRLVAASPLSKLHTESLLNKLHEMVSAVIRGLLVVAVCYGLFVGVGFFIFGLPSAILWGGVTVLASFIPGIGVMLIVVPGIIYLFATGNTFAGIGLIIWTLLMIFVMENIARPRLLGGRANIHPLLMLLAVLGGLSFFGPIGILLGPLALSFMLTLIETYPNISESKD